MKKRILGLKESADRGAVMFLVAATVLIVLLMGAIAVDLSIVSTRGQSLQNAADSAALAGVQAMRAELDDAGAGDQAAAQQAARDAVAELLAQNGIDTADSTSYTVTFPDPTNNTQVEVTVTDGDPGTMLTGVTGVTSEVERTATAEFEACQASCTVDVVIPSPFRSVEAMGEGDGFMPISVGNNFYAINHSSSYGGIVCIDRTAVEDENVSDDTEYQCWEGATTRRAYDSSVRPERNPEMPHTAVVGTRIYWTASNTSGTYLFCFETTTNVPCPVTLVNTNARINDGDFHYKDRDHGGGAVAVGNRVFTFTDDHRVHCFDTTLAMTRCLGYELNGKDSYIGGTLNFPDNEASDGNHGSSIDRVFDPDHGRIYWSTKISTAYPPADCSADNLAVLSGIVSIQNSYSSLFMSYNGSDVSGLSANANESTHWIVEQVGVNEYVFRSVVDGGEVLDADNKNIDSSSHGGFDIVDTSSTSGYSSDDVWTLGYDLTASTLRSSAYGTWLMDSAADDSDKADQHTDFVTHETQGIANLGDWVIKHPDCFGVPVAASGDTPSPFYSSGTWVQCWDTVNNQSCTGFEPEAPVHTDGSRFSGRLFLYMSTAADPIAQGICSTGFDEDSADNGSPDTSVSGETFELVCLNPNTGDIDATMTANMSTFEAQIDAVTDGSPAAWGVPHYNEFSNRLFYPSAHDIPYVLCWDFDSASYCQRVRGAVGSTPIEDYGLYSEGNCVYGLGHNSLFWAFQAEDIFSECTGSTTRTIIEPCDCSGEWKWGTITFDVELDLFDEFFIQVLNSEGDLVYPVPADPEDPNDPYYDGHSLHDHGIVVDLNNLPVSGDPDNDFLEILVYVSSDSDPWAEGEQSFAIEFARAPRLVD